MRYKPCTASLHRQVACPAPTLGFLSLCILQAALFVGVPGAHSQDAAMSSIPTSVTCCPLLGRAWGYRFHEEHHLKRWMEVRCQHLHWGGRNKEMMASLYKTGTGAVVTLPVKCSRGVGVWMRRFPQDWPLPVERLWALTSTTACNVQLLHVL